MITKEIKINLNAIDKVKAWCRKSLMFDGRLRIMSNHGEYIVDGKSIMGIFSLDLLHNLTCEISAESEDIVNEFVDQVKEFIA